ncbi:MAG TPA: PhoPQ-activated protein PqaA family protein, partial [Planctomycetota bacterium]|nr:PhoPQ-activated protein PqaA family protein [Planctomycetota bacterium]
MHASVLALSRSKLTFELAASLVIIATSFLACDTAIARALEGDVAPAANVENAETKSGPATALEGAKETGPAPSASEPADPPGASPALPARTAFDDYLDAKDDVYAFQVVTRVPGEGYETVLIELTSQEWLTPREVDRTVWKHWLVIVRPDVARSKHAFLYVSGGSNRRDPPSRPGGVSIAVARATGSVVAELRMVPNQPLEFFDDGKERYEDDLIAHAWTQFLKTGEPRWLPRLPMVKSVVRAMDAIQAFTKEDSDFPDIERFVVAGGSKRGWTTWFAGLDSRVAA